MSYAPNPEGLRSAFAAERFALNDTTVQFTLAEAGRLTVSDGHLAAGDAQADPAPAPFTQCVPDGDYPVTLALALGADGGQGGAPRIAYARVLLDPAPARHWYPALTAGQDARTLPEGGMFGYTLASGTACFASGGSQVAFAAAPGHYASYFGYDGAGRAVALLTDFGLLPAVRDLPRRRRWWQHLLFFWK